MIINNYKKFKFNKKNIIATDCKIVSEDENGIVLQMKMNNNESQKLSDLSIFEKVSNNDYDWKWAFERFLCLQVVSMVLIIIFL